MHANHSRYYRVLGKSFPKLLFYADSILEEHNCSVFAYDGSDLFANWRICDDSFIGTDDIGEAGICHFIRRGNHYKKSIHKS